MEFSLSDLGLAFRKAKVDLYYSSHASILAIAKYEADLANSLRNLHIKITQADETWVVGKAFLGDWTLVPKSINPPKLRPDASEKNLVFASANATWKHDCEQAANENAGLHVAEFRLMARCSMDLHVLSSLWILKVGHKFDKKLSNSAGGNRLRRTLSGEINSLSLGSFKPYLKPFRDWRDGGIRAMKAALALRKKVVALTADVSSFYHELNPNFMLSEAFLKKIDLTLDAEEKKLHRLFISSIQAWAQTTPLKKGLPVGLPASAVIANMALCELDFLIEKQVAPLYYGRYVDDIILVMENGADFKSINDVWSWLFLRMENLLNWSSDVEKKKVCFKPGYLKDSNIYFANKKNKVFLLEGSAGKSLVDSIAHQINARASEWRALANLPMSAEDIGTDLIAATQKDGAASDNLRKTDALTMRRAGFAIKLRDFEAYERDLPPASWTNHRHAFLDAFVEHVLVLPNFFELEVYLSRVIRLAIACEDFGHVRKIINAVVEVRRMVAEHCKAEIKSCDESALPSQDLILDMWQQQFLLCMYESILAAFPPNLSTDGKQRWHAELGNKWDDFWVDLEIKNEYAPDLSSIKKIHAWLFAHDLAHMPFRFIALPKEMIAQRGISSKSSLRYCEEAEFILPQVVVDGIDRLSTFCKIKSSTFGFLFAVRPFSLAEIFVILKDPFAESVQSSIREVVLAVRGFSLNEKMPRRDWRNVLVIPDGVPTPVQTVAVSSWKTTYASWIASVMQMPDPDLGRYARLTGLINTLIAQPKKARYLILPELSLPTHWFLRIALKLQGRGISLITGVEYLHLNKKRVRHQVWASFSHDGLGFSSTMIYRQDKQRPALHEEQELKRLANLTMAPENSWSYPPILQHGEFRFSILVCSELTNIANRAYLRGKIDALFVPEWNKDTETFNALIESAALDIHAYIIQCNDRSYGDSRIRSPSKNSWDRDILRVKGGVEDYCVIGEIDIHELRKFQSSHRSPSGPFKPVPDGFFIDPGRKMLPRI